MTAFSLPWYAIVGVQAALGANLGYAAAVLIGIIATTAGRWLIDVACNVVPKQLVRGEFFVTAAALTGIAYLLCSQQFGLSLPVSTAIAFFVGFGVPPHVASVGLGRVGAVGARSPYRRREVAQEVGRGIERRTRARLEMA